MQIRVFISGCLSFLISIAAPQVSGTILFSTSLESWQSDMTTTFSRHLDYATFKTTYGNIAPTVSEAFSALPDPSDPDFQSRRMDWNDSANNVDLGRTAVFDKVDTGFRWGFQISAKETDTVKSSSPLRHGTQYNVGDRVEAHVIYNDRINRNNFDQVNAFTDVLSIGKHKGFDTDEVADGDPYAWDNDDFGIEITSGPALYALAFEIVNNKKYIDTSFNGGSSDGGLYSYGRESITITDINGQKFKIQETTGQLPIIPGYYNDPATPGVDEGKYTDNFDDVQFIGIVSDTPFTWLEFNEDSRSDDIGIKNLMFAGTTSPVPLPAAFWFFSSSLIALMGLGRRRSNKP